MQLYLHKNIVMFNFLKKRETDSVKIQDKVWMNELSKFEFLCDEIKKHNDTLYVFWFDETLSKAELLLSKEIRTALPFITAREITSSAVAGRKIIFAEHYPLAQKEKDLFLKLHLKETQIWSSLDEPLFQHFGGEKIVAMMKKLGIKENEAVEHKMLTKSIQNAQQKIETKVLLEQSAASQKEWIERNLSA